MTQHAIVTLSDTTPTLVSQPGKVFLGEDLTIQNIDGSAEVFVGGPDVSATSYGFKLAPGGAISFEVPARDKIYVISDTDESEVAVLRLGLETSEGA
jgi:hypothetical protein